MNVECPAHQRPGYAWLEVHHIIKRRPNAPDLDKKSNLITLCVTCHRAAHNGLDGLTAREWMIATLERSVGEGWFRWQESYEKLKARG